MRALLIVPACLILLLATAQSDEQGQGPPEQAPPVTVTVQGPTKTVRVPGPTRTVSGGTETVSGGTETVYLSDTVTETTTTTRPGKVRKIEVASTTTGDLLRAAGAGLIVIVVGFGTWLLLRNRLDTNRRKQ